MDRPLEVLAKDLEQRGKINLDECFVDGIFSTAKKGDAGVGKTKRDKGCNIMATADRSGLPVSLCTASATPHETTFLGTLIASCFTEARPQQTHGRQSL